MVSLLNTRYYFPLLETLLPFILCSSIQVSEGKPVTGLSTREDITEIRLKARELASTSLLAQAKEFRSWGIVADWGTNDRYLVLVFISSLTMCQQLRFSLLNFPCLFLISFFLGGGSMDEIDISKAQFYRTMDPEYEG